MGIQLDFHAFSLTMFEGLYKDDHDDCVHMEYYKAFKKAHTIRSVGVGSSSTAILSELEEARARWVHNALEIAWRTWSSVTSFRGMRLTRNAAVDPEDLCCLGATIPLILAPVGEDRHKLVSDCNIHGIMGDELVDKLDT